MNNVKITNGLEVTIDCHYFYIPFKIESTCPRCGKPMDLGSGNYVENHPVHLNGENEFYLYCRDYLDCRYSEPIKIFFKCEGTLVVD